MMSTPPVPAPPRQLVLSYSTTSDVARVAWPLVVLLAGLSVLWGFRTIITVDCQRSASGNTCVVASWLGPLQATQERLENIPVFDVRVRETSGRSRSTYLELTADGSYVTTIGSRESVAELVAEVEAYRSNPQQTALSVSSGAPPVGAFPLVGLALLGCAWWMSDRVTLTFDGDRKRLTVSQGRWWATPVVGSHSLLGVRGVSSYVKDGSMQVDLRSKIEPISLPRGPGVLVPSIEAFLRAHGMSDD